jgi:hypothetical protein
MLLLILCMTFHPARRLACKIDPLPVKDSHDRARARLVGMGLHGRKVALTKYLLLSKRVRPVLEKASKPNSALRASNRTG